MNAPATLLVALVCCVTLGGSAPAPEESAPTTDVTSPDAAGATAPDVQSRRSTFASSNTVSSVNGMLVKISERQVNDECVAKLLILGRGINKTQDYPCGKAPVEIINVDKALAVGDEWYSDEDKTLVHLTDSQCQKEIFTEQNGMTSSTSETLSDEECQRVRTKLAELKEEQRKLKESLLQQQYSLQQQFQQMHHNFLLLQQQLGSLYGK